MLHINKTPRPNLKQFTPQNNIKLCKTCKHFKQGICHNFVGIDLLDGIEVPVSAFEARSTDELCGKDGHHHVDQPITPNMSMPFCPIPYGESQNP